MKKLLIILMFACNKPIPVHIVNVDIIQTSTSVFHIVLSEQLPNPVDTKIL